jgi:hypothetical protein
MQAAVLADLCTQLGVNPQSWHTSPLFRAFVIAGVLNLAGELHKVGGVSRERALLTAAVRCGVASETVRSWRRRARAAGCRVQDEPVTVAVVAA